METRGFLLEQPLPTLGKFKSTGPKPNNGKTRKPGCPKRTRFISVIIPAHNEEAYLANTLQALKQQNYPRFEVIVVANGCKDNTAGVGRGNCHRLIVLSQKGLGIARNLGARMAQGDMLLFLDADTLLEPGALRRIAEDFTNEHAAGTLRGTPDSRRFGFKLVYFIKNFFHSSSIHKGSSGVILCWKKHFVEAGGFDEGLEISENSDLIKRLTRFGSYKYIGEVTATTSMRRYEQRGFCGMAWLWLKLWLQSLFGDLHQKRYEAVR